MKQPEFIIPSKLQKLQNKLLKLRQSKKFILQNGDMSIASAPSNIALIKYWGKSKDQFQHPDNSSISFTLNNFHATTTITVLGSFFPDGCSPSFIPKHEFFLSDSTNSTKSLNISPKLITFLKNILIPFATEIGLKIESHNNFPTACGLASSAAGFAALCFALADLFNLKKHFSKKELQYWISQWARIGSGSALRSTCLDLNSKFVAWELKNHLESEIKNIDFHKNWNNLKHCVFVIDNRKKEISSSSGHLSADTSVFHNIRISYADNNFEKFKTALKSFDFDFIAQFTEQDALLMHATMQTSAPPAVYLSSKTSKLISEFISFRKKENLKAFWTLDAGPNLHILYLNTEQKNILRFHKYASKILKQKINLYE